MGSSADEANFADYHELEPQLAAKRFLKADRRGTTPEAAKEPSAEVQQLSNYIVTTSHVSRASISRLSIKSGE